MVDIKGTFPALPTPMKEDGNRLNHAINYEALKQLIEFVIKGGVNGIVPSGCTGHAAALTVNEQIELIAKAREYAKERVLVIAGDGSNCTREAIELARKIEDVGVNIHMQISPYQNKPTQEGIYQHYAKIAESIDGEIIVYNVPGRTGKNVEPETVYRLAKDYSNVIGIKEASGNLAQIKKVIELTSDLDFAVISGDDALTYDIIKAGGKGCISVAANVAPKEVSEMISYALQGNYEKAEKLNTKLKPLFDVLFIETNPCPLHYALKRKGINVGVPRLPLVDVTDESKKKIDSVLKDLGLI
ncbi:MAG: 4-hydroxy-tetrahydrodipicolinate synthase [Candidatus Diapherotrites archaeon]|nr:4-hydroxy-tetrahydrodipicolinate synthase [Candidatus Diapherotrites archaeon]